MESLSALLTIPAVQSFVNDHGWVWPVCEIFHYIGLALIVGFIGALDMRILGLFKSIPIGAFKPVVPVVIIAFVVNLITGLVFVTGMPLGAGFYVENLSFQLKLLALLIAGVNLIIFSVSGLEAKVYTVPAGADAPARARTVAWISLVSWVSVIVFGRLLMYNDTLLYFLGV